MNPEEILLSATKSLIILSVVYAFEKDKILRLVRMATGGLPQAITSSEDEVSRLRRVILEKDKSLADQNERIGILVELQSKGEEERKKEVGKLRAELEKRPQKAPLNWAEESEKNEPPPKAPKQNKPYLDPLRRKENHSSHSRSPCASSTKRDDCVYYKRAVCIYGTSCKRHHDHQDLITIQKLRLYQETQLGQIMKLQTSITDITKTLKALEKTVNKLSKNMEWFERAMNNLAEDLSNLSIHPKNLKQPFSYKRPHQSLKQRARSASRERY